MLRTLTNLTKAAAAVVITPAAIVADVLTLPGSAFDNKAPFHRTGRLLSAAGRAAAEAVKPIPEKQ